MEATAIKTDKVTMYRQSMFGIVKTELKSLEITFEDYAQYKDMPLLKFVEKGKRKIRGLRVEPCDYVLVLKGHNHPNPEDGFCPDEKGNSPGVTVSRSKHTCFSSEYKTEFMAAIKDYINQGLEKDKGFIVYCH